MRTQTQSMRQRLVEEQSRRYLNESELPFSAPVVDADTPAGQTAARRAQQRRATVAYRSASQRRWRVVQLQELLRRPIRLRNVAKGHA